MNTQTKKTFWEALFAVVITVFVIPVSIIVLCAILVSYYPQERAGYPACHENNA